MNDEKPREPRIDGRPFDGGLGPTAQAAQGVPIGRPQLDADQLHGDTTTPSWKAPAERHGAWTTGRIVTLTVLAAILALVICLKIAGVV